MIAYPQAQFVMPLVKLQNNRCVLDARDIMNQSYIVSNRNRRTHASVS